MITYLQLHLYAYLYLCLNLILNLSISVYVSIIYIFIYINLHGNIYIYIHYLIWCFNDSLLHFPTKTFLLFDPTIDGVDRWLCHRSQTRNQGVLDFPNMIMNWDIKHDQNMMKHRIFPWYSHDIPILIGLWSFFLTNLACDPPRSPGNGEVALLLRTPHVGWTV